MVARDVEKTEQFVKSFIKCRDESFKEKIAKQLKKIVENPELGKPMRYSRKGTREVYVKPYRLSYKYIKEENKIIVLALYHKDEQ